MMKEKIEVNIASISIGYVDIETVLKDLEDINKNCKCQYESIMVIQDDSDKDVISDELEVIGTRLETDKEFEDRMAYLERIEEEKKRVEKNKKRFPRRISGIFGIV